MNELSFGRRKTTRGARRLERASFCPSAGLGSRGCGDRWGFDLSSAGLAAGLMWPGSGAWRLGAPQPRALASGSPLTARRFDHHCRRARPARHLTAGWCSIPLAAGAPALLSTSAGAPERLPPAVLRRHMCGTLDQRAKAAMSDKADKMQRARGAPRARRWRTPQAVTSWWRC